MFAAPEATRLVEHLGAGTTFDVALVQEGDAVLVCKRLRPRMQGEPAARAALVREAKFLALVRTPAVPIVVRVGADAHGPFVLETRMVGVSLRALGDAWRARAGAVPAALVAHVAVAAAEAIAELHACADAGGPLDAAHGDVAPDQILFGPTAEISLVDFGAARARGLDVTADADERGTLPFVAPELARGEAAPSAATDTFALAASLVSFALGEPLTRATEDPARLVEVAERGVRVELVARAPGLSAAGRAALTAALAFDRASRLTSARELARALRAT